MIIFSCSAFKSKTVNPNHKTNSIFQFNFYFQFAIGTIAVTLPNSSKQEVLQYKGHYYKKTIGRAYHSYWICIKTPCNGKIRMSELKGGSVTIVKEHDKCDDRYAHLNQI